MATKTKIYFAGPLFTQGEWEWNKRIATKLRGQGITVILPQEAADPMLKGTIKFDARSLFMTNIAGIEQSDIVLAALDQADPDSGTCWECGYAYKLGRPIIGLRTDLRRGGDDKDSGVNLMLSQACKQFITVPLNKLDDEDWLVQEILKAIKAIRP